MLVRVLRHDAETDEIAALRRAIGYGGAHHALDVPAEVYNAGELREIGSRQVRARSVPGNVERIARQENRPSLRAQLGSAALAICDTQDPGTLSDRPVDQIPCNVDAVPVRHRGACLAEHAYDVGVVHPNPDILKHLPGIRMDLFAIVAV
jgi:hypothetical protein